MDPTTENCPTVISETMTSEYGTPNSPEYHTSSLILLVVLPPLLCRFLLQLHLLKLFPPILLCCYNMSVFAHTPLRANTPWTQYGHRKWLFFGRPQLGHLTMLTRSLRAFPAICLCRDLEWVVLCFGTARSTPSHMPRRAEAAAGMGLYHGREGVCEEGSR
jgi:hypothetical protein